MRKDQRLKAEEDEDDGHFGTFKHRKAMRTQRAYQRPFNLNGEDVEIKCEEKETNNQEHSNKSGTPVQNKDNGMLDQSISDISAYQPVLTKIPPQN